MNKLKSLALAALTAFGLTAYGGETTTKWWEVDFESPTPKGVDLPVDLGGLGSLTNDEAHMAVGTVQPYTNGVWIAVEGDESYITNEFNTVTTNGVTFGSDVCLKLDTQGNDLTWSAETNDVPDNIKALVDADLYLVGSDSEPAASDFDAGKDVHTAIYLKNETHPDTGETTNSVLCVYAYDGAGNRYWQELAGVELADNAWAHVQVVVDYTDAANPMVQVFVNGTQMHARDNASATSWPAAITAEGANVYKLSSVAFRGTGAVDNFVGTTQVVTYDQAYFKAEVYLDNDTLLDELCQVTATALDIGGLTPASFTQFLWEEYDDVNDCSVYGLERVEITDFANNRTQTYSFNYDPDEGEIDPMPTTGPVAFYGKGFFSVTAETAGAPGPATEGEVVTNTIVKIFFKTSYANSAIAETVVDGVCSTNTIVVKPADFEEEGATKDLAWEFPATKDGTVLSTIQVYENAALAYADGKATVTKTLTAELAADTLYVTATYLTGTLAEGYDLRPLDPVNGLYTFEAYKPPVAMIGTTPYDSLRGAITNATAGDTITLLRDDRVSFTVDDPILDIDFEVTIDGGSNTLYGLTDYNGAGYHEIRISGTGNVTIKNLKLTEFSDSAPMTQLYMPICTRSTYTGTLTLDGVTIDKFNRVALLLCGGDFLITNCVITGNAVGTTYFQSAVETYHASGTVVETTISGIGALNAGTEPESGDAWASAVFTVNQGGTGTITVKSGTYTGQFVTSFNKNSTGAINLEDGVFIATVEATEEAFLDDSNGGSTNTISGGWFDREPAAGYLADGYKVVDAIADIDLPEGTRYHVVPDVETTPEVEVGDDLDTYNAAHAGEPDFTPVEPITFAAPAEGQDELCTLAFVAPADGWYFLYTSTTVTGPFQPDYTTKVYKTEEELVRLTESAAGTSKFFKIGWSADDPDPAP